MIDHISDQDGGDTCASEEKSTTQFAVCASTETSFTVCDTGIWHLGSIAIQLEQEVGMDSKIDITASLGGGEESETIYQLE